MRWVAVLIVLAGLAAIASLPATGAGPQSVALTVLRSQDKNTGLFVVRFRGTISSSATGEDVTVLQQTCGYSSSTAVAGTQTRGGGAWEAEPASQAVIAQSATYRARWRNEQSAPVRVRPALQLYFFSVRRGSYLVRMTIGSVQQNMTGRNVLLQRKQKGRWTTVKTARLVADGAGGAGFAYAATFKGVKRGWKIRARLPAKSAAPCFKTGTSEEVVSG